MNNKKTFIAMMVVITILLVCVSIGVILDNTLIRSSKITSDNKIAECVSDTLQDEELNNEYIRDNVNDNMDNTNIQEAIEKNGDSIKNIEDARFASISNNKMIQTVSSRSEVERLNINPLYVSMKENVETDYEELKSYIKLSEVKISIDMDVSKTTGLSQEDFVELVAKMKYDRTGILEKNAAWIWECCQKYNVNEIFVLGICGIESGWCSASQHQRTHNYSSLMSGGKLIPYSSDEQGFEAMIKLLGQKYLTPGGGLYHGKTIAGVGTCYCNPTSWPSKVYKCMTQVFE